MIRKCTRTWERYQRHTVGLSFWSGFTDFLAPFLETLASLLDLVGFLALSSPTFVTFSLSVALILLDNGPMDLPFLCFCAGSSGSEPKGGRFSSFSMSAKKSSEILLEGCGGI